MPSEEIENTNSHFAGLQPSSTRVDAFKRRSDKLKEVEIGLKKKWKEAIKAWRERYQEQLYERWKTGRTEATIEVWREGERIKLAIPEVPLIEPLDVDISADLAKLTKDQRPGVIVQMVGFVLAIADGKLKECGRDFRERRSQELNELEEVEAKLQKDLEKAVEEWVERYQEELYKAWKTGVHHIDDVSVQERWVEGKGWIQLSVVVGEVRVEPMSLVQIPAELTTFSDLQQWGVIDRVIPFGHKTAGDQIMKHLRDSQKRLSEELNGLVANLQEKLQTEIQAWIKQYERQLYMIWEIAGNSEIGPITISTALATEDGRIKLYVLDESNEPWVKPLYVDMPAELAEFSAPQQQEAGWQALCFGGEVVCREIKKLTGEFRNLETLRRLWGT
jgi:hypothetical protein